MATFPGVVGRPGRRAGSGARHPAARADRSCCHRETARDDKQTARHASLAAGVRSARERGEIEMRFKATKATKATTRVAPKDVELRGRPCFTRRSTNVSSNSTTRQSQNARVEPSRSVATRRMLPTFCFNFAVAHSEPQDSWQCLGREVLRPAPRPGICGRARAWGGLGRLAQRAKNSFFFHAQTWAL